MSAIDPRLVEAVALGFRTGMAIADVLPGCSNSWGEILLGALGGAGLELAPKGTLAKLEALTPRRLGDHPIPADFKWPAAVIRTDPQDLEVRNSEAGAFYYLATGSGPCDGPLCWFDDGGRVESKDDDLYFSLADLLPKGP